MASALDEKKKEATKKGVVAAATAAGSVALLATTSMVTVPVIGLGVSAVLGYRWVKYRIEHSIRF